MNAPRHFCEVSATPWAGIQAVRTCSERHFNRHWHQSFGIGLLDDGAQRSASGRGEVDAQAGDLLACNPGEVHDGRPLDGRARQWHMLHIDREVLVEAAGRVDIELTQPVIRSARLRVTLQQLLLRFQAWQSGGARPDVERLACDEGLAALLGELLAAHASAPPLDGDSSRADACLSKVRARLADDLCTAPSLDELAVLAQLGKYQLLRRFTRAFGLPPHAWLLQQRVARAQGAIRAGAALSQAAADAGFADQSHMTRAFKRQFGFTPGAWQRAVVAQ